MPRGHPLTVQDKRHIIVLWKSLKHTQKIKKREFRDLFDGMIVREVIAYLTGFGTRQVQQTVSTFKKTGTYDWKSSSTDKNTKRSITEETAQTMVNTLPTSNIIMLPPPPPSFLE